MRSASKGESRGAVLRGCSSGHRLQVTERTLTSAGRARTKSKEAPPASWDAPNVPSPTNADTSQAHRARRSERTASLPERRTGAPPRLPDAMSRQGSKDTSAVVVVAGSMRRGAYSRKMPPTAPEDLLVLPAKPAYVSDRDFDMDHLGHLQMSPEPDEETPSASSDIMMSPMTTLVRRHISDVAIVRSISLRDAVNSPRRSRGATPRADGALPAGAARLSRPGSACRKEQIRRISTEEVTQRSRSAAAYFHRVRSINSMARSPEELAEISAEVRRRREESTEISGALARGEPPPAAARPSRLISSRRASKESPTKKQPAPHLVPAIQSLGESIGAAVEEVLAQRGEGKPAAEKPAAEKGEKKEAEKGAKGGGLEVDKIPVPKPPGPKSLLEKFGYGVKAKEDKGQWAKLRDAIQESKKQKENEKKSGMIEAQKINGNDLLARLKAKKEQQAQEQGR